MTTVENMSESGFRQLRTWRRAGLPRKNPLVIVGALVAAISLAACSYTPTLISSPTGDKLPPALDNTRMNAILESTNAASAAGDQARDWQPLASRFTNPALAMRNGEYVVTGTTQGATISGLPLTKPQAMVVQEAGKWPRYAFTVSPATEGQSLFVFAFAQSHARANYSLWGYVKLFPKVKFPATFKPEVGSPAVPAKSKDFLVNPGGIAPSYAALLNNPEDPAKDVFDTALDSFMATYKERRTSYDELVKGARGLSVTISAAPGPDGFVALGTTDGGALVMSEVTYEVTMKSERRLNLGPAAKAMTGKTSAASTLSEKHTALVLFSVPPAGSKAKVSVLGASDATTAMSAD